MADTVRTQLIHNGPKNYVVHLTNTSDGTGENKVKKVDIATINATSTMPPIDRLSLLKYTCSTINMGVIILWEATTSIPMLIFPQNYNTIVDLTTRGGIANDAGAGRTGNVLLSTVGAEGTPTTIATAQYDLYLEFRKHYA
jgi:hypothetical protein